MKKSKVIVFVANGNEETELVGTIDVLRRADIQVVMVSISDEKNIVTSHGITIQADALWNEIHFSDYQMLVFPGGLQGAETFKNDERIIRLVQQFDKEGKFLAAICAAPIVLGKARVLRGKKATCYTGFEAFLGTYEVIENQVVIDKNIITAPSVAYTLDFGLAIVQVLCGKETKEEIAKKMLYYSKI